MPTPLPPSADFTGGTVTEGGFKTAITSLRTFLSDLLGTTGSTADARIALGVPLNATTAKTANYTVVAADSGKLIDCTSGTFTLTLTAAATLGDGFAFAVRNTGSGVVTIDPNGAELIDGASTITLGAGETAFVVCNGSAFRSVCRVAPQIGIGQAWQSVTGSRAAGTTYTNSTGRPIQISITPSVANGQNGSGSITVGGVVAATFACFVAATTPPVSAMSVVVPPGASYLLTLTNATLGNWSEMS